MDCAYLATRLLSIFTLRELMMRAFNLAELLFLGLLWGCSFLFIRVAVPELGAISLMMVRTLIAALFLLPIMLLMRQQRDFLENWRMIAVLSVLNTALPFTLLGYATLHTNAGIGSILNALVPIFTPMVAFVWFRQRLSRVAIFGIGLGFFGVYLIANGQSGSSSEQGFRLIPIITGMLGSLCYAVAANFTQLYFSQIKPLALATGCQLFGFVLLLPLGLYFWPATAISGGAWWSAAALGVLSTGISFIIFFHLLSQVGASFATLVAYLIPLFSITLGYLFLGEIIKMQTLIGGGFVVIGIALVTGVYRKLNFRKTKLIT